MQQYVKSRETLLVFTIYRIQSYRVAQEAIKVSHKWTQKLTYPNFKSDILLVPFGSSKSINPLSKLQGPPLVILCPQNHSASLFDHSHGSPLIVNLTYFPFEVHSIDKSSHNNILFCFPFPETSFYNKAQSILNEN